MILHRFLSAGISVKDLHVLLLLVPGKRRPADGVKAAGACRRARPSVSAGSFFVVADQQLLALSAFSFPAYRTRILLCQLFHGIPVGSLFDKNFFVHCLFHPAFTPFLPIYRLSYHKIKTPAWRERHLLSRMRASPNVHLCY